MKLYQNQPIDCPESIKDQVVKALNLFHDSQTTGETETRLVAFYKSFRVHEPNLS